MINPRLFPGAWFIDATPSGSFVALTPRVGFETHLGSVPLPPGEPWGLGFVRCTDVGGFRFAGQAHSTIEPACWEWTPAGGWRSYPQPCVGVSPVIYDFAGVLHRSTGAVGSQGYRYVRPDGGAGVLVSGDETYGPFNGLSEYSAAADLLIGQSATTLEVRVWDGAVLRRLASGNGRFVRVQPDAERVSIAYMTTDAAVRIIATLAELRALPPVSLVEPPPPVPPHPPLVPPPPPKGPSRTMKLPNEAQAVVDALYAKNIALAKGDDDQRRVLTKQIAETVRFRLGPTWGWKSAGTGRPPSKDAIALQDGATLWGFDLFNGSTREPNRNPDGENITGQTFIVVPPIDHLSGVTDPPPPPPPPPAPPAPPVDLSDILRRLDALERKPDPIIPPPPDLSGYARKGDRVTVSGRVSFGINKWGGSIDK